VRMAKFLPPSPPVELKSTPRVSRDSVSFRVANLLVGNPPGTAGLEMTLIGPELLFRCDAIVALAGAPTPATLDGVPFPAYTRRKIKAGQKLQIGAVEGKGCRTYLAVRGGFPRIADYLGSKATTPSFVVPSLNFYIVLIYYSRVLKKSWARRIPGPTDQNGGCARYQSLLR
jgi:hypothetical protein